MVKKLKLKKGSGILLKVSLLVVGPVVMPRDSGSYCHISMGSGLGRSDLEPFGLQKKERDRALCWVPDIHCPGESSEVGTPYPTPHPRFINDGTET